MKETQILIERGRMRYNQVRQYKSSGESHVTNSPVAELQKFLNLVAKNL